MRSKPVIQLAAASFATLALELVLIRWVPGQVRVVAYFPNLILMAAFLGIGAGCLLPRKMPLWSAAVWIALLTAIVSAMSRIAFTNESPSEFLWLFYFDLPRNAPEFQGVRTPIMLVFVLTAAAFVPLGGFVADRLNAFRDVGKPLSGYAADLIGSFLGVIVLSLVLVSGARPIVWFAVVIAFLLMLSSKTWRTLVTCGIAAVITLVIVQKSDRAAVYSPYYALTVKPRPFGSFDVLTNGSFHQQALPLALGDRTTNAYLDSVRSRYHLPYRLLGRKPHHVLILGAGTGNDVAVALSEGAEEVDAVEIDPQILRIGAMHPDRPYSSPRVRQINTDAREHLNYTSNKYDLIVFGTLDSMTRLSALSNVRLDNYVYTVECLQAARRDLTPDGGIVMMFMVHQSALQIERHISALLVRALDERPVVLVFQPLLFNRMFLAGPAFRRLAESGNIERVREAAAKEDAPTDDWPFLYLRGRSLSPFYLSLIGAVLLIAIVTVFGISREMRESVVTRQTDPVMFLFGAAFLLTETKLVTEMNLVWGATWLTSSVVFASILLTILIGTLWMSYREAAFSFCAPALVVALLINWAVPVRAFVGWTFAPRLAASFAFIGLPMLFASMCFAIVFRRRERVDIAFGWNMLGAVAGGLLEFTSMIFGIKAMTLLAIAAYLLAIMLIHRERVAKIGLAPAPAIGGTVPAGEGT